MKDSTSQSKQKWSPTGGEGGRLPQISEAEHQVMKIVWNKKTVTANEVVAALERKTHWRPKTIHTLLRRLVNKGAVAFAKNGREHVFSPLVDARSYAVEASKSFLIRFFDGDVAPFLSCLLENKRLSAREIEELRRILDEK